MFKWLNLTFFGVGTVEFYPGFSSRAFLLVHCWFSVQLLRAEIATTENPPPDIVCLRGCGLAFFGRSRFEFESEERMGPNSKCFSTHHPLGSIVDSQKRVFPGTVMLCDGSPYPS